MAARASLFLVIVFLRTPIERDAKNQWVIWNVGQGLWTTYVTVESCWHFDMGGERADWSQITRRCRAKRNFVHFSHWDSDHIGFAKAALRQLPDLCRWNRPQGRATFKKERLMDSVFTCDSKPPFRIWNPERATSTNEASAVVVWHGLVIPGDSPKAAERSWSAALPLGGARILVLGHHGSRTSSSTLLLSRMPGLRVAVASARERRYGHPHQETELILRKFRVPLLRTEDWGNIHFWQ